MTNYFSKFKINFKIILNFFNNLSVGQKVMTIIGVEILSYSVVTTISLMQLHLMGNELRQITNLHIPLLSTVELIQQNSKDEALSLKDIVFFGDRVVYDENAAQEYLTAKNKFNYSSNEIINSINKSKIIIDELQQTNNFSISVIGKFRNQLLEKIQKIQEAHDQSSERINKVLKHVEDGSFLIGMELLEGVADRQNYLSSRLDDLKDLLDLIKLASVDYANQLENSSSNFIMFASFLTVLLVIIFFIVLVRKNISMPLQILTESIRAFEVASVKCCKF